MDNAGALGGSLIAAAVLAWSPLSISQVIMWSALPGMMGVLLIAFGVREPARHVQESESGVLPPLSWAALSTPMRHYLLTLLTFSFARTSETFILLRGYQLGMGAVQLLLLWGALNLSKVLTSTFGGRMADAGYKPRLMLASWIAFAVSFFLFGQISGHGWIWLVSCAYGLMIGLSEGAERALISDFAAAGERGTAFGWYHLMVGAAAIPAGLVFGGLWHYAGAQAAFSFAALTAAAASLMLYFWTLRHMQ